MALKPYVEAMSKRRRKAGAKDPLCGILDVIRDAVQLKRLERVVVDPEGCSRVPIAGLTDASRVDDVGASGEYFCLIGFQGLDALMLISAKHERNMRMAHKTQIGIHNGEGLLDVIIAEKVVPLSRRLRRGMD